MNISTHQQMSLIDTNILVYRADHNSDFYEPSVNLIQQGMKGEIALCLSPQNLAEFYAVITDQKRVTNPLSPMDARAEVEKYFKSQNIRKIYQTKDLLPKLLELMDKYQITRQQIFDLQLVAMMLINDVTQIYTFNRKHFEPYQEIQVLCPE